MPNSQIRRVVVCLLLSVFACSSYAQDIHFSQFSQSPLYVNPAYTGLFKGDWRFSNNYRNQWSAVGTPFKTISAGFDKPFKLYEGKLGLGVFVTNDQSGSYQLTANKIFLSASYHYKYRQHTFSGGIQAGYTIHSLNTETLIFPVQYNPNIGFYDDELPNYIDNWDENINYADINLGIAYSTRFQHINAVAALSAYHINSPSLSFLGEDARLAPRFAFNAYADIPLKNQWFVKPNIFTSFQKKASDYLVGGVIGYDFPVEELLDKVYLGTEFRTQFHSTDAVVAMLGVSLLDFDIGISYDVNISGLAKATNMRGAFEISLIYTSFRSEINQLTIPCDRY